MGSRAPYGARGLKSALEYVLVNSPASRPVWGAWIEISSLYFFLTASRSRPVWGAWIEISLRRCDTPHHQSRPVWGAWIEMVIVCNGSASADGRAPYGARGLK